MTSGPLQFFISHVEEDETIALALKTYIEELFLGAAVFVSGRDLSGGEVWFEELRRRLESATAVIALISPYSKDSRWVYFESGAGFTRRCTIPLAVGNIQVSSLPAPMKLLQARNLDETGMRSLTADLAKLAALRQPTRYPGLDEALRTIQQFLKIRQPPKLSLPSAPPPVAAQSNSGKDPDIAQRVEKLKERARRATTSAIVRRKGTFDLPSIDEMESMSLTDLFELGQTVGVNLPLSRLTLTIYVVPAVDMPAWKRMNQEKALDDMEREWMEVEKAASNP